MKWIYIFFGGVSVFILGMWVALLFGKQQGLSNTGNEKKIIPITENGEFLKPHWVRESELYENYRDFILSSSLKVSFSGKIKSITKDKLVLEKNGKMIELINEARDAKTNFFESGKIVNGQLQKSNLTNFSPGDNVQVEVEITPDEGKTKVMFIWKLP